MTVNEFKSLVAKAIFEQASQIVIGHPINESEDEHDLMMQMLAEDRYDDVNLQFNGLIYRANYLARLTKAYMALLSGNEDDAFTQAVAEYNRLFTSNGKGMWCYGAKLYNSALRIVKAKC